MRTLSASQLKLYKMCPQRYYYEYIEGHRSPQNAYSMLGTAVHKAIEEGCSGHPQPLVVFYEYWLLLIKETGITPEWQLYHDGMEMVRNYAFNNKRIDCEKSFILPFPDKQNPVCKMAGFIDQIHEDGTIVDLKSGKKAPTKKELSEDPQFILYAWAYEQMYGRPPKQVLWHHLRTSKDIVADVIGKNVNDLVYEILTVDYYRKSVGRVCSFCPFTHLCKPEESNDAFSFKRSSH